MSKMKGNDVNDDHPDVLASGEAARLFPVLADTAKEGRTLSVFLACLSRIQEFGSTLLKPLGLSVGIQSRIQAFTEITLAKSIEGQFKRPDGLIAISRGKQSWSAIVEAKIKQSPLEKQQISDYMKLARANGIDAVITVSNQFAAVPSHHPVAKLKPPKNVQLFHWSWASILTHAKLLLAFRDVEDPDQRFLLTELVRFLEHPISGVVRFDTMKGNWKAVVKSVKTDSPLKKTSDDVTRAVASWHQETRDLALKLTESVSSNVMIRLSRAHKNDPKKRIKDDIDSLSRTKELCAEYVVPDAASPIRIVANLGKWTINVSMRLPAPTDKQKTRARVNWILRQLKESDSKDLHICAYWPRRAEATQQPLESVRENPDVLQTENRSLAPTSFEIRMVRDVGGRFSGAKTFIKELEETVPHFYKQVGQRLKRWQPTAPKIAEAPKENLNVDAKSAEPSESDQPASPAPQTS